MHIDSKDAFLIGTYEFTDLAGASKLFPKLSDDELQKKLKEVNNRFGSLYLYVNTHSALGYREFHKHSCESGGVFDVVEANEVCKVTNATKLFVAHANGTIGQYDIILDSIVQVAEPLRVVDEDSVLLTSIDCLNETGAMDKSFLVVGDSNGGISLVIPKSYGKPLETFPREPQKQEIIRTQICHDLIWQVKFLPPPRETSQKDSESKHLWLLVGADDSKWYIYKYDNSRRELQQIYKNDDFRAGVTSFCVRPQPKGFAEGLYNLYVGSYDETIKEYCLKYKPGEKQEADVSFDVNLNGVLKVTGAGIWRMTYKLGYNRRRSEKESQVTYDSLNIASMYTEPCMVALVVNEEPPRTVSTIDSGEIHQVSYRLIKQSVAEKPLYYGFVHSRDERNYCILDFNNKLCTFIEHDALYTRQDMLSITSLFNETKKQSFSLKRWLTGGKTDGDTK